MNTQPREIRTVETYKRFEIVFHTHLEDQNIDITESILTNDPSRWLPILYEADDVVSFVLMDEGRKVMHHNKRYHLPALNQTSMVHIVQILGGIPAIVDLVGLADLPVEIHVVHLHSNMGDSCDD